MRFEPHGSCVSSHTTQQTRKTGDHHDANFDQPTRLTSAQFLGAHRRAGDISDLYAAVEEMPILAASDPSTMKQFFDELADVQATQRSSPTFPNASMHRRKEFEFLLNPA